MTKGWGDPLRGGFHHIDLNVSDLAASRPVYATLLGFLGYTLVRDDATACEWDLQEDGRGASLGIKQCAPAEPGHRRTAPGLHHLAWRAESRADVDAFHALLVEQDIKLLDPPAHYPEYSGDYYALFFEDPDGMKLELVYSPGWV